MHYTYTPSGVHSKSIEFDIEDNIVKNVKLLNNWEYLVICVEIALKMLYNHYDYKIGNFGLIYRRS